MTTNASLELALRDEPQAVMLTNQQLIVIANTDFVPKGLRGNVPACLAAVARGRAMGVPDMVALNGIAIINGKATLSAELMVAIVREHGHSITGDVTATSAKVKGKRRDNGDTMTAEFNMEMAEAAGLFKNNVWKQYPDDMMWARAVSKLCRRLFADCFAGGTYAPDDMEPVGEEIIDEERPEPVDLIVPDDEIDLGLTDQWDPVAAWQPVIATFGQDRSLAKWLEIGQGADWKTATAEQLERVVDALKEEEAAIA